MSGAVGNGSEGVTTLDGVDSAELPMLFVACTVKLYATPLVRPEIVVDVVPALTVAEPPGVPVTVYPVIAEPPSLTGACHVIVACPLPAVADTLCGAVGADGGGEIASVQAPPRPEKSLVQVSFPGVDPAA